VGHPQDMDEQPLVIRTTCSPWQSAFPHPAPGRRWGWRRPAGPGP
jgi:hypothetical protein